jgi:hypothetical protein
LAFFDLSSPEHYAVLAPRGVDLISDALLFGGVWYDGPNATANAIDYAKFFSRSHDAVIRLCARVSRSHLPAAS